MSANSEDQSAQLSLHLDNEWSFNFGSETLNASQLDKSQDQTIFENNSILVDKNVYEQLVATCDAMKAQLHQLMEMVDEKTFDDQNQNSEEMKLILKERDELKKKVDQKSKETVHWTKKYYKLKAYGQEILKKRENEIKLLKSEVVDGKKKLNEIVETINHLEDAANKEKIKRKNVESEMRKADKIIKDALREEMEARKQSQKEYLLEKTERMALEEKISENAASARGVIVRSTCPVADHHILNQRIDVLQRQRKILVESINKRDSPIHH
ncbi:uncharacterized protein CELE_ZK1098.6 [Caenorhabditis elegans]|uniref:Uncharacterized protein ZK1098.6 n=1 Tax=Caenorhabditis elegans TaxID=6239 RepID=YO66_CAEEL|nr:Uncharacterized protein CELE_ZK1098.6 [Caenorhabditis elegans]P34606.2 RecName: Full=Uncharacterized protein ZK1098.6 [Caenorhabditis elegans]CAA80134.2 Uncharacterized protein CELE_ZK1098.6 [Caenorhabditis elegans]|eukprot:NP_499101.2 Uncharacterized protein CELE_ZK1098.6 [Caenorhabditis elegans]